MSDSNSNSHSLRLAVGGFLLIILMLVFGFYIPMPYSWLLILVLLIAFFMLIGYSSGDGRWNKIFIDDRNQMSLSRFQVVLWTLLILSAYFAIALARVHALFPTNDLQSAMVIALPWQLLALLGISLTAVIGTPLILSQKKEIDIKQEDADRMLCGTEMENIGTVCQNKDIKDAKFVDMFHGDELADCSVINMAKVQMFFFTIVIVLAYGVLLLQLMVTHNPSQITGFPPFTEGTVALLGISNAGYLTQKAVPTTPTK